MNEDNFYRKFGQLVRQYRRRLKITQVELAARSNVSRASIANIETGRQKILLHQVYNLAESLEIEPQILLPELEPIPAPSADLTLPEDLTEEQRAQIQKVIRDASVVETETK